METIPDMQAFNEHNIAWGEIYPNHYGTHIEGHNMQVNQQDAQWKLK